jgi:hypothetical protein
MEKIVLLSLGKSGTTSAADFFNQLNYKTIHFMGERILDIHKRRMTMSFEEVMAEGEYLEKEYDVFTDYPYCMAYEYFDKKYSNTKFILITRDVSDWIKSVQHWTGYWNSLTFACFIKYLNKRQIATINGTGCLKDEDLQYLYESHTKDVLKYFKNSKNFIHLNLNDEKIGQKILEFLKISSDVKFPCLNISNDTNH